MSWLTGLIRSRKNWRTRELMDTKAVRDCLVEGYEYLIPGLSLPDEEDGHVLAAVTRHRANLKIRRSLGKIISTRCFDRACRKRWCDCGSVRWPSDKTGFSGRYRKAGLPSEQVPARNCQRRRRRNITTARPVPSIAQVDGSGTTATECTWLGRLAPRWN